MLAVSGNKIICSMLAVSGNKIIRSMLAVSVNISNQCLLRYKFNTKTHELNCTLLLDYIHTHKLVDSPKYGQLEICCLNVGIVFYSEFLFASGESYQGL
jgi:hypothetical protein